VAEGLRGEGGKKEAERGAGEAYSDVNAWLIRPASPIHFGWCPGLMSIIAKWDSSVGLGESVDFAVLGVTEDGEVTFECRPPEDEELLVGGDRGAFVIVNVL
jgi:hypothetical protein